MEEISRFLASRAAVSSGERGYRYMCDWVTQNANRLRPGVEQGEVYGVLDDRGEWAYVIGSVFRRAAEDAGFSSTALLSWLRERGLIQTRGRNNTRGKRVNGVLTECVVMRLSQEQEPDDFEEI